MLFGFELLRFVYFGFCLFCFGVTCGLVALLCFLDLVILLVCLCFALVVLVICVCGLGLLIC